MTATVFAFLGGRDRIGTTTTAVSVGVSMAETATRVAVIDAAFDSDGIEAVLGVSGDDGIRSVLRGDATLDEAMVTGPHGVDYLPSGSERPATTDVRTHRLLRAAETMRERYDVVLLDLGHGGGVDVAMGIELADETILVGGSAEDDLSATADVATVVRQHGCSIRGTVLSRVPSVQALDIVDLTERLRTDVLAVVPEDDAVPAAAAAGQSLLRYDPDSDAAMVYWQLASTLTGSCGLTGPVLPASAEPGDSTAEPEALASDAEHEGEGEAAGDEDVAARPSAGEPRDESGAEDGTASDTQAEPSSAAEGATAADSTDGGDTDEQETGDVAVAPSANADSYDREHPDESAVSPENTPEDEQSAGDATTNEETTAEPNRRDQVDDKASVDGRDDDTVPEEEPVLGGGPTDVSQPAESTGDDHTTLDEGVRAADDERNDKRAGVGGETDERSAPAPGSDEQSTTDTELGASGFDFDNGTAEDEGGLDTESDSPADGDDTEFELPGFDGESDDSDDVPSGIDDGATPTGTDAESDSPDRDTTDTSRDSESADSDSIGESTAGNIDEDSTPEDADGDRMFEDVSPDPESLLDDEDGDEDDEINALFKETMDKVTGTDDDEE